MIKEKTIQLIKAAGGEVYDDILVTKPGICLISKTESCIPPGILDVFNISENNPLMELNSKITYMNFNEVTKDYINNVVNIRKHYSVLSNIHLGFLIAGVKGETVLELASSVANISRQTTSRTKSANETLYVCGVNNLEALKQFLSLRKEIQDSSCINDKDDLEEVNGFNLFNKAMSLTMSMPLGDWLNFLKGRIENDYEYELKYVAQEILKIIKAEFKELS